MARLNFAAVPYDSDALHRGEQTLCQEVIFHKNQWVGSARSVFRFGSVRIVDIQTKDVMPRVSGQGSRSSSQGQEAGDLPVGPATELPVRRRDGSASLMLSGLLPSKLQTMVCSQARFRPVGATPPM